MVNVAHVPLQLDRLLPDQFECRVRRRLHSQRDPRDGIDGFFLREEAELEMRSDWLLSGPIVKKGIMNLTVNVILNTGEVGYMLHLTLLLYNLRKLLLLALLLLLLLFWRRDDH